MANGRTSVQLSHDTWKRLNQQKQRPNETFDDVVKRVLDHYEECDEIGE